MTRNSMMTAAILSFLISIPAFANDPCEQAYTIQQMAEQTKINLASQLHDEWRAPRLLPNGTYEPRIKNVNGIDYDIANLVYADLPAKFKYENQESARVAIDEILKALQAGKNLDSAFIEEASDVVHVEWMKRNDWAAKDQPELFLPFNQLSKVEADKDRVMVKKALSMFLGDLKKVMIEDMASQLHDEWRAPRLLPNGTYEPRIKNVNGIDYDIANLPYSKLPAKFQWENQESARVVTEAILAQLVLNNPLALTAFIEEASDVVHIEWMKRNDWAAKDQPELFLPFNQLSKVEADKDRVMVKKGLEIFKKLTSTK